MGELPAAERAADADGDRQHGHSDHPRSVHSRAAPGHHRHAPLDRFEILSEPGSDWVMTGTARLLACDITTERTVEMSSDVSNANYRNGVLLWSTALGEPAFWHTLDLCTV